MQSPQQQGLVRSPQTSLWEVPRPQAWAGPRPAAVTGRAEVRPQCMPHVVTRPGPGVCRNSRPLEPVLATRSWLCSWGAEDRQREESETPPDSQGAAPDPARERLQGDCHSPLRALLCLLGQATERLPPIHTSPWTPRFIQFIVSSQLTSLHPLSTLPLD